MPVPLNPTLFGLLERRFGEVQIADEGAAMQSRVQRDLLSGKDKLVVIHPGEYYRVSCPFCSDTRHRLYINHRWGVASNLAASVGGRNLWLFCCFNEHCEKKFGRADELLGMLLDSRDRLRFAVVRRGKSVPQGPILLPGEVTRVDALPADHKVVRYLRARFFDPELLGKVYHVGWCAQSHYFYAAQRLIIPVYDQKVLCGWQARYLGERDWKEKGAPPKYFNCPRMKRNLHLYNYDQAKTYQTGVICEGVTDVWAFGGMAVALLGASLGEAQERKVVAAFGGGSVVLLLDADREDKPEFAKIVVRLKAALGEDRLAVVVPPGGRDPASFDREFLRQFVAAEAAKQGVPVVFERKPV